MLAAAVKLCAEIYYHSVPWVLKYSYDGVIGVIGANTLLIVMKLCETTSGKEEI